MLAVTKVRKYSFPLILAALVLVLGFVVPSFNKVSAADPAMVEIPVQVEYTGNGQPEETFTIELSGGGLHVPIREQVTLSAGKKSDGISIRMQGLSAGVHTYRFKQLPGSNPDIVYDDSEYDYYVNVNDDGTVEQQALSSRDNTEKPDKVTFSNSYRSSGQSVIGDPPIRMRKQISGTKPPKVDSFVFVMEPEEAHYPLPEGYGDRVEVTVRGEEEVEIGNILFNETGVYRYKIHEKDERVPGYNCDDSVYEVVYTVTKDQNGRLLCEREIIKNSREAVTDCVFENVYGKGPKKSYHIIKRGVKTGDPTVMIPITAAFLVSLSILVFMLTRRKKDSGDREQ